MVRRLDRTGGAGRSDRTCHRRAVGGRDRIEASDNAGKTGVDRRSHHRRASRARPRRWRSTRRPGDVGRGRVVAARTIRAIRRVRGAGRPAFTRAGGDFLRTVLLDDRSGDAPRFRTGPQTAAHPCRSRASNSRGGSPIRRHVEHVRPDAGGRRSDARSAVGVLRSDRSRSGRDSLVGASRDHGRHRVDLRGGVRGRRRSLARGRVP